MTKKKVPPIVKKLEGCIASHVAEIINEVEKWEADDDDDVTKTSKLLKKLKKERIVEEVSDVVDELESPGANLHEELLTILSYFLDRKRIVNMILKRV
jgi:hypothetical protein